MLGICTHIASEEDPRSAEQFCAPICPKRTTAREWSLVSRCIEPAAAEMWKAIRSRRSASGTNVTRIARHDYAHGSPGGRVVRE
jgi:hypothetical protein